jgi:hypothetical protein
MEAAVDVFEEVWAKRTSRIWRQIEKSWRPSQSSRMPLEEETEVETIRTLLDRYGVLHLAIGPHRQWKKRTQGDGGSWKKLADYCRRMTWRAIPSWCKGRGYKGPTVKKRRRKDPECNNGIGTSAWNSSYAWDARRNFMRPSDKPSSCRSWGVQLDLLWGLEKRVLDAVEEPATAQERVY